MHATTIAAAAQPGIADTFVVIVLVTMAVIFLMAAITMQRMVSPWFRAQLGGVEIPLAEIIGMRFRRVDANLVIRQAIRLRQAQLDVAVAQLESHFLAGGRVSNVVGAVLAAKASGVALDWQTATALDLAGYDVLAAARMAAEEKMPGIDLAWCRDVGVPKLAGTMGR